MFACGQHAVLAVGREQTRLDDLLDAVPAAAMLPAIGVAWSLGFTPEQIRSTLLEAARRIPEIHTPSLSQTEPAL